MRIWHISRTNKKSDITELVLRCTWSGDIKQVARKLELSLAVSEANRYLPQVYIDLGEMLLLEGDEGRELWRGYVFTKNKSLSGTEMSYTAYDGLIYLTKSKISKNFKNMTAEQITKLVCTEFGVPVGSLASTKNKTQSFVHSGKTVYEAIMTAYTNAYHHTEIMYMPRMRQGKLDVIPIGETVAKQLLTSGSNITEANFDENIDSMINTVVIVNDKDQKVHEVKNELWQRNYGLLQDVVKQDSKGQAKVTLQGVDRTASMQVLGGKDRLDLLAGHAVKIKEDVTGLTGLFYITGDSHTFENGNHNISLNLSFEKTMDEHEAEKSE